MDDKVSAKAEDDFEAPVTTGPSPGLVPKNLVRWLVAFVSLVLLGFFVKDVLKYRSGASDGPGAPHAASAPIEVGVAPSEEDIRSRANRAEQAASAAQAAASTAARAAAAAQASAANGPLEPMVAGQLAAGAVSAPSKTAIGGSGRHATTAQQGRAVGNASHAEQQPDYQSQAELASTPIFASLGGEDSPVSGAPAKTPAAAVTQSLLDQLATVARAGESSGSTTDPAMAVRGLLEAAKGKQQANTDSQFLREYASQGSAQQSRVTEVDTTYMLYEGTKVPVAVREAISSDHPGKITAYSMEDVYDSPTKRVPVLPRFTYFIGTWSTEIRPGQSRLLIAFNRAILPDGRNVDLSSAQAVDNVGRAGIEGEVDNHFLKMFGHSLAIAMISTRISNRGLSTTTQSGGTATTGSVAGEVLGQITQQTLSRNSNIPPTLTTALANPFYITLSRDVRLPPYKAVGGGAR